MLLMCIFIIIILGIIIQAPQNNYLDGALYKK